MLEQTTTSITFLVPGHYPASTTKVRLRRSGEIMTLGEISVTNGEAPKEFKLYGIVNSHSDTSYDNCIEHVNLTDGSPKNIVKLAEDQKDFSCVVNVPESQNLCGIQTIDGVRKVFSYDLSMHFWQDMGLENILTLCNGQSSIIAVRQISTDEVILATTGSWPYTRNMDQTSNYRYKLPVGIRLKSLTRYPGVQGGGSQLLLSADNGNNSFTPVVLDLKQNSGKIYIGDPIQATALIPFWTIISIFGRAGAAHGDPMKSAVARIAINICRIIGIVALMRSLEVLLMATDGIGRTAAEKPADDLVKALKSCPGLLPSPHIPHENVQDGFII